MNRHKCPHVCGVGASGQRRVIAPALRFADGRRLTMMADRFRERLAVLDREALLSYAAELSVVLRHTADVLLATHSPLPSWARDEVMLSADLLPLVFATLRLKDGAAASVCQAWKAAWEVTNDSRRGLRPLALPQPDFELKLVDDDGGGDPCLIDWRGTGFVCSTSLGRLVIEAARKRRRCTRGLRRYCLSGYGEI